MGLINRFLNRDFYNKYGFSNFIETGTGLGLSLKDAVNFDFKKIYSIDIDNNAIDRVKRYLTDPRIELLIGDSTQKIAEICENNSELTLFWLDAHFPFCYTEGILDKELDKSISLPLEKELFLIKQNKKNIEKDVLIIDDLRIYEDGPFGDGNWDERKTLGGEGIEFIYKLFEETHNISKDFRDQGYIVLEPK